MHDGDHPFNKAKDKHETKQIDYIIGSRSRQRNRAHHSFRSNVGNDNDNEPCRDEQLDDHHVDEYHRRDRHDHDLHTGIGLPDVPHNG